MANLSNINNKFLVTTGGNVGIGVTGPTRLLQLNSSGQTDLHLTSTNQGVGASDGMTVFLDSSGTGGLWLREAQSLRFATNSSEKMTILSGGNVVIGTTSPSSKLTVSGPSTPSLANGENSIRIERHSSAAASPGVIGNGINFAQKWWSGSAGLQVTGGIYGIKNASNGTYGGGLAFYTQPSSATDMEQRMVIDTSGNVGIGTTSPKTTLDITGSGNTAINSKGNLLVSSGGTATQVAETGGQISFGSWLNGDLTQPYPLAAIRGVAESSTTNNNRGALIFGTMDSNTTVQERMRITSGGELYVGHSSTNPDHGLTVVNPANGTYIQLDHINGTVSGSIFSLFRYNQSVIGSITQNGTSQVSFNISSDYRLKEDLKDFAGLDMVSKIPVYDFKWKVDGYRSYGVMAHELQEVLPQAVSGDKDAEEMQGVDYSKIVPLLVKSIQELKAEVDKLKQECKCKN